MYFSSKGTKASSVVIGRTSHCLGLVPRWSFPRVINFTMSLVVCRWLSLTKWHHHVVPCFLPFPHCLLLLLGSIAPRAQQISMMHCGNNEVLMMLLTLCVINSDRHCLWTFSFIKSILSVEEDGHMSSDCSLFHILKRYKHHCCRYIRPMVGLRQKWRQKAAIDVCGINISFRRLIIQRNCPSSPRAPSHHSERWRCCRVRVPTIKVSQSKSQIKNQSLTIKI